MVLIPLTIVIVIVAWIGRCLGFVDSDWPSHVVMGWLVHSIYVVVGVLAWVGLGADFADSRQVRLPLADPAWGSLLVMAAAAAAGLAASIPIGRYRERHLHARRRYGFEPKELEPEPEEEFWSPTPVTAWRSWRWNGQVLHGVMHAWPEPVLTAACPSCSEVPGWSHTCGIYAVTEECDVATFGSPDPIVVGKVELSGLVIEHDKGYRAEHARIVELFSVSKELARTLAITYPDVEIHLDERRGY